MENNYGETAMPAAIARVIGSGEGSTFSIAGVTVTLKVTGEETGGACTIFEALIPPHFVGHEPYGHGQATATYYVTSGLLAFTIAQETVIVRSGAFVMVPPGTVHKFWNPTATPATCLTYLCPAGFEHYLIALAALANGGGQWSQPNLRKVTTVGTTYDLCFEES